LLFGSDFPVCLLSSTYRDVIESVSRWAERLTLPERESLFGGTATAVYRLEG
jgi:L-fuconolactonase